MKLALQIGKKKSRMSFENSSGFLQDDGSGHILRKNHAKVKSFQCHGITGYFHLAVISKSVVELLTFTKLSSFLMSFMDKSTSSKLRQGWKVDKRSIWCQTKRYSLLLSKRRGSPWLWKGKQSGSSWGDSRTTGFWRHMSAEWCKGQNGVALKPHQSSVKGSREPHGEKRLRRTAKNKLRRMSSPGVRSGQGREVSGGTTHSPPFLTDPETALVWSRPNNFEHVCF